MDADIVAAAGLSAVLGTIAGALMTSFRSGRAWERVESSIEHVNEKLTLISDELARRITVLENRVQFDGMYIRTKRSVHEDDQ